ncbi:F0F1 ATP synthase subunit gamma [Spirillospora sp. NPDC047279]|uniref:F0F1 ATP synthase subunit gamma n=1 Tax=Spirillospora sp. NPDC047279 TaxID=3155478 RepID=UPI00340DDC2F
MAAQLRALRSRIRSVKSTAKITRAQELIAAARISTAQQRVAAAKPYSRQLTQAVSALVSHHVGIDHPLLNENPDASRAAVLLMTGDRGFCGAYNHNVLRQADLLGASLRESGCEPVFYVCGRRGVDYFRFRDREMAGQWTGQSGQPTYALAEEIGRTLVEAFRMPTAEGGIGGVHVIYTEFVSMISQRMTTLRILPLEIEEVSAAEVGAAGVFPAYEFEPAPVDVLDGLLHQYVRGRIWHLLLESAAAEWAARRSAMMSATDNANELIGKLTQQMNEARQAQITVELSEIVAGADALADRSG